jgi:tellurite resistance protein
VKRQRPTTDTPDECLVRLAREPADEQRRFLLSAIALAEADGQRDTTEVTMLFDLQRRLAVAL